MHKISHGTTRAVHRLVDDEENTVGWMCHAVSGHVHTGVFTEKELMDGTFVRVHEEPPTEPTRDDLEHKVRVLTMELGMAKARVATAERESLSAKARADRLSRLHEQAKNDLDVLRKQRDDGISANARARFLEERLRTALVWIEGLASPRMHGYMAEDAAEWVKTTREEMLDAE